MAGIKLRGDGYVAGVGPLPAQQEVHRLFDNGAKLVLYNSGIRSGKTWGSPRQGLRFIYQKGLCDPYVMEGWCVAPTYDQTARMRQDWIEMLEGLGIEYQYKRGDNELWLPLPEHCSNPAAEHFKIRFKSAERFEAARGHLIAWMIMDEPRDVREEAWFVFRGRTMQTDGPILLTSTPKGKGSWIFSEVVEKSGNLWESKSIIDKFGPSQALGKNKRIGVVCSSTFDNPTIPDAAKRQLEEEYPDEFGLQELYGRFVSLSGLVYKQFDRSEHVVDPFVIPDRGEVFAGMDFGTGDPMAIVLLWRDPRDGIFYLFEERYVPGIAEPDDRAQLYWDMDGSSRSKIVWCDPNAEPVNRMQLKKRGINIRPAPREKDLSNSRGIRHVAELFSKGKLKVFRSCKWVIKELQLYRWKERKGLNTQDKPRDKHNHTLDALRYALWSHERFGKAKEPSYKVESMRPQPRIRYEAVMEDSKDTARQLCHKCHALRAANHYCGQGTDPFGEY